MMAPTSLLSALRLSVLLVTLAVVSAGCAAVSPSVPVGDLAAVAAPDGTTTGMAPIDVEVRAAGRQPEFQKLSLQSGMHVQDALEQTKLTKRFQRMNIRIMRPANGQLAKLDIKYNHQTGRVNPLFDYALYPGDHLVVIEDTSGILDDMLNSISLPVASTRKR